ncbi:MAG: modA [Naasia sp.]|uniref:molybdate ABC transporter substrate-binding protein n=1 Tax=Naasia sp. TaxID=2546198 RepID=UPI0026399F05|nr:molybdate ABC transporter substrate-binding protein [Naasia sp.]MCU1570108.1 modA [Naasia sp.]
MTRAARRRAAAPASAASVLLVLLCGCSPPAGSAPAGSAPASASTATLSVFAAASLTDSFDALGRQFEEAHPGVTVVLNAAGSAELAQQILSGAPADILATASDATMATVADAGLLAAPAQVFARNSLEIAVPPGNPGQVAGLADFSKAGLLLALCAPEVPCGASAAAALTRAGVSPDPDTLEQGVTSVLTKVRLGEVDAGIVYRTDVLAAGGAVVGVPIPDAQNATTDYPIAVLAGAQHPALAEQFVALVRGSGQDALREAGFAAP